MSIIFLEQFLQIWFHRQLHDHFLWHFSSPNLVFPINFSKVAVSFSFIGQTSEDFEQPRCYPDAIDRQT